ncbi:MAG: PEGA domain-containing protein, partial [Nannocystaceae bacterium]|nr:PEGA domain-containing protein [Nannocystaceae bacterium]
PSAVPEGLIELIEDCLQKDRTLRPANADAIVERLIDVVPAALFRLPRADTARHGVASNAVPPGHGNTGMMELLGTEQSPSKPISTAGSTADSGPPNVQEAGTGRTKVPAAVPVTNPSPPETLGERPKTGTSTWVVVAAVLAALGLVAWFGGDWDGDSTDDASAVGSPPSVAGAPKGEAVLRALQAASAHINAGELDQAEAQLDGITALATASASARAQHTKLERQLKLRRLMRAGARFEAGEQAQAALDTYRDALAIDPAFVAARVAVTRLEEANAAPDHADHEVAHAAISSAPRGTLLIDGKKTGKTPYNDSLSVGVHRVEIRARGYTTWKGELEVKADGAAPLAVVLCRRGAGRDPTKRPRPDSRPEAATTPEPSKPEPSKPEPSKPEPASKPDPATKPGPFLPTKAKDKDSVFLPTKD